MIISRQNIESHTIPHRILILCKIVFFMQKYGIAKVDETVYAGKISRNREGIFIKGYAADICTPVRDFLSEGEISAEHASSLVDICLRNCREDSSGINKKNIVASLTRSQYESLLRYFKTPGDRDYHLS